jgi:hypothetical protein
MSTSALNALSGFIIFWVITWMIDAFTDDNHGHSIAVKVPHARSHCPDI